MTEVIPKEFLAGMVVMVAACAIFYPSFKDPIKERIERQDESALLTGNPVSIARALERGVLGSSDGTPLYSLRSEAGLRFVPVTTSMTDGKRITTAGPLDRRTCMTALTAFLPNTLRQNALSITLSGKPEASDWKIREILEGDEIYMLCESGGYISLRQK